MRADIRFCSEDYVRLKYHSLLITHLYGGVILSDAVIAEMSGKLLFVFHKGRRPLTSFLILVVS